MTWARSTYYQGRKRHGKEKEKEMAGVLKKKKEQVLVSFTTHGVNKMTNYQRLRLSNWLREQADFIQRQGEDLAPRYRARFMGP